MLASIPLSRVQSWVHKVVPLLPRFYCATSKVIAHEDEAVLRDSSVTSDFETKTRLLRGNKLTADRLIRVLQGTCNIDLALRIFKWASLQPRFSHNAHTYYWMILNLGISCRLDEMESYCFNMFRENCHGAEKIITTSIESFVRQGSLNAARRVLLVMCSSCRKLHVDVFNLVLRAYVAEKSFSDAVFLYKEMVKASVAPDVETLNCLLEILFATDRVDSAMNTYKRIGKTSGIPNIQTFEIMIYGLLASGDVDRSIATFGEMSDMGCNPDLGFYTRFIPLYCEVNNLEFSMQLYKMMNDCNILPNSSIFESLIHCLCKNSKLDDATKLLQEMVDGNLTPSNDVLVHVAYCFCSAGYENRVINVLKDTQFVGIPPYHSLLSALCGVDKISVAVDLLSYMWKLGIADTDSWHILLEWYLQKEESRKASALLGKMIVSSLSPNAATYSALISALCKSKDCVRAMLYFRKLCAEGWFLDSLSYTDLIRSLCNARRREEAVYVFRYMSESKLPLDSLSFDLLFKEICGSRMVTMAVSLRCLASCYGITMGNQTDSHLLRALIEQNDETNLLAFLARLLVEGRDLNAEAFTMILRKMIASSGMKQSAWVANKMVEDGFIPDAKTLRLLLSFLRKNASLSMIAWTTWERILDGDAADSAMYDVLVAGHWEEGDDVRARKLLDAMLEKGFVPDPATHEMVMTSRRADDRSSGSACILDELDAFLLQRLMD